MEGQVTICYETGSVLSQRPFAIQKLLAGRRPEQAIQFIGLAYSLCAKAQQFAAGLALETLSDAQINAMSQLLRIETLKEHYISLARCFLVSGLIDTKQHSCLLQGVGTWLNQFQQAPTVKDKQLILQKIELQFETMLPGLVKIKSSLLNNEKGLKMAGTAKSIERLTSLQPLFNQLSSIKSMTDFPSLHRQPNIESRMFDPKSWDYWVKQPGQPDQNSALENSPYSRIMSEEAPSTFSSLPPLQQRLMGKIIDCLKQVVALEKSLKDSSIHKETHQKLFSVEQQGNVSIAWVETARGRLYHLAQKDKSGTHIINYAISAPTEWNFHPQGIAQQLIATLSKSNFETWKQQVELIVEIIDPCVPNQIIKKA